MSSKPALQDNKHHLTIIAALLSMIGPFTIDAYLPSFPDIEITFGISRAMLSQSLAIYLIAFAVSTLMWGPLSDRIGRRLVIMASLFIYTSASIGCALADNTNSFMLFRVLQGFAASGGFIASRAMIRDAHDAEAAHRAMAHVILLFAVAPAIAPIIGAWLHDLFGWRSVFWFLALLSCLLLLMTVFIEETLASHKRRSFHPVSVLRVYVSALKHPRFVTMTLSLSFGFAGIFLYIAGSPSVIYDFLGLGTNDFGLQFVPMVSGMMLGAFISSKLAHRWLPLRIIYTGFGLIIIAMLLNLLQVSLLDASVITIIGPLVIYAVGLSIMMPAITILALDCFPENRGAAASMQGFFQMSVNAAVASIAVPLLHTQNLHFVLGQLVFMLISLGLWYVSTRYRTPTAVNPL